MIIKGAWTWINRLGCGSHRNPGCTHRCWHLTGSAHRASTGYDAPMATPGRGVRVAKSRRGWSGRFQRVVPGWPWLAGSNMDDVATGRSVLRKRNYGQHGGDPVASQSSGRVCVDHWWSLVECSGFFVGCVSPPASDRLKRWGAGTARPEALSKSPAIYSWHAGTW